MFKKEIKIKGDVFSVRTMDDRCKVKRGSCSVWGYGVAAEDPALFSVFERGVPQNLRNAFISYFLLSLPSIFALVRPHLSRISISKTSTKKGEKGKDKVHSSLQYSGRPPAYSAIVLDSRTQRKHTTSLLFFWSFYSDQLQKRAPLNELFSMCYIS